MICIICHKEIKPDEKRFYSRQPGMQGMHHWFCYTVRVNEANERGAREIEVGIINTGITQSMVQMSTGDSMDSIYRVTHRI